MIQNTNRTSGEKKKSALEVLKNYSGPEVKIMEVCGTHTHEIFRLGIRKILPPNIRLISGPGCPVCVFKARRASRCAACGLPIRQHLPYRTRVHHLSQKGIGPPLRKIVTLIPHFRSGGLPPEIKLFLHRYRRNPGHF